jgi:hypothetical protein
MRKQYYFRPSSRGYFAWDVDRLVSLTSGLRPRAVSLSDIAEIDEACHPEGHPTYREIAGHAKLIDEAELRFPIIMSAGGRVMDGMHRVMKALNAGLATIDAVVFEHDPPPDYVDVFPEQLPY